MKDANTLDRDEVLSAFQDACAEPTAEDIIAWVKRFPQFADDIRDHAAITLDWVAQEGAPEMTILDGRVNDAYSQALAGLQAGDAENTSIVQANAASFQDLLAAHGKTVAMLEQEIGGAIGISRSIIAALINGGMTPPIGSRFRSAVMRALSVTSTRFDQLVEFALSNPRLGLAKSSGPPKLKQRSYEDVMKSSGMESDQIEYWLGED